MTLGGAIRAGEQLNAKTPCVPTVLPSWTQNTWKQFSTQLMGSMDVRRAAIGKAFFWLCRQRLICKNNDFTNLLYWPIMPGFLKLRSHTYPCVHVHPPCWLLGQLHLEESSSTKKIIRYGADDRRCSIGYIHWSYYIHPNMSFSSTPIVYSVSICRLAKTFILSTSNLHKELL